MTTRKSGNDHRNFATDEEIDHFAVYRSTLKKCSICMIPKVIAKQVFDVWDRRIDEGTPFTGQAMKTIARERCGECMHPRWPTITISGRQMFLHVATRHKLKVRK